MGLGDHFLVTGSSVPISVALSEFSDPARFSFALGAKDGHPLPILLKTYDEAIGVLREVVDIRQRRGQDRRFSSTRSRRPSREGTPRSHFGLKMETIWSPALKRETPEPTATTSPARSDPGSSGNETGCRYLSSILSLSR
jgi:hypothetical protein